MAARKPLFMGSEGFSEEMAISDSITLGGLTMGGDIAMAGNAVTGLPDTPPSGSAAVNKNYVDAVAQSLTVKAPVIAIETAVNVTLSGLARTIDDIAIDTDGMRVLVNHQTTGSENGIWVAHSGAWTRPADFAAGAHAAQTFVFVEEGTATGQSYADTGWVCTTNPPGDVIGTDGLAFVQFSAAGVITAGDGLQKIGQEISAKKGDGIELTSNSAAINVDLETNSGLKLNGTSPNKKLMALVKSTGGIDIDGANGLEVKLNGTTLQSGSGGVSVKGVPSLFEIGGTATGATVTAPNLDTVTDGSNADALHTHSTVAAPSAARVEDLLAVTEAIAAGDPVYFSSTNDQVSKADTVDSKAKVIGVARTAQSTPGNTAPIVAQGPCPTVLSGATAGTPYYLATGGGLSDALPGAGKRVVQCGIAKSATDLWVRIVDYGKKAA